MTPCSLPTPFWAVRRLAWLVLVAGLAAGPLSSARAHGDEPHGDAPHATAAVPALPRFETATETFELVGRLEPGALRLDLQRFETSAPVADARIDLELGTLQASARFEPDTGRYRVDDPGLLESLTVPGTHALVITVTAGDAADLMDATLEVAGPAADATHDHPVWQRASPAVWGAGTAGLAALSATLAFLAGRRSARRASTGAVA